MSTGTPHWSETVRRVRHVERLDGTDQQGTSRDSPVYIMVNEKNRVEIYIDRGNGHIKYGIELDDGMVHCLREWLDHNTTENDVEWIDGVRP